MTTIFFGFFWFSYNMCAIFSQLYKIKVITITSIIIKFKENVLKEGENDKIQNCMPGIVLLLLWQLCFGTLRFWCYICLSTTANNINISYYYNLHVYRFLWNYHEIWWKLQNLLIRWQAYFSCCYDNCILCFFRFYCYIFVGIIP